jgi:hypothetical protein
MQQDADIITADFLYIFRASRAHHQECKILKRQPPLQVVLVAGLSSLRHIRDETVVSRIHMQPKLPVPVAAMSVFYTPDDGRVTPETCRESLQ